MLVAPEEDPRLLALEGDLRDRLVERLRAGARPSPDADAIAVRSLMADGLDRKAGQILRGVLGRIEAAQGAMPAACGAVAAMLTADRYGAPTKLLVDPDEALATVRTGGRAIIDIAAQRPWWGRLLAMPDARITVALPDDAGGRPRAVMVSLKPTGPTGDDRTFWVTDNAGSEARIVAALAEIGLAANLLTEAGGLKLFMLAGYVQPEDGRLAQAPGTLKGVIGAAPVF